MTRAAKKIHAFRTSGTNKPGYSQQQQNQPAVATPRPSARRTAPPQPYQATTVDEAIQGLQRAAAPKLVTPRFNDTSGPWVRLAGHETRVPADVAISMSQARDGRRIAVLTHLDESDSPGRVQVLVSTDDGVKELVGLSAEQLRELRREHFGR